MITCPYNLQLFMSGKGNLYDAYRQTFFNLREMFFIRLHLSKVIGVRKLLFQNAVGNNVLLQHMVNTVLYIMQIMISTPHLSKTEKDWRSKFVM